MKKAIISMLATIIGVIYAIGNISIALNLTFPDIKIQSFANKFSLIHFMTPGNNFVGSSFWLASKSIPPMTITLNGENKTCTKQIRWLYFNSQRGQRLRPLDSETLTLLQEQNNSYDDLSIIWWLYTTCEGDPYSVVGAITYVRKWNTGYLVAGTKLNYPQNKINPQFAKSLQYFDNKVLIGYLYDSNGGIGYVGGNLTGHENLINFLNTNKSINEAFMYSWDTIVSSHPYERQTIITWNENNAMETMRNLIIQGSVWLSKSMDAIERFSLLGNLQNKTLIYNGGDINASTLINVAKQNAQKLCQGKEKYEPNISKRLWSYQGNIVCIENNDVKIDLNTSSTYKNKTIIVKNANVILEGGMKKDSPALNIFIDNGIIYLPEQITRETFDNQWFPDTNGISSWLYLKGNFIVNGLMIGGTQWNETWFNHKLHFQWKITILNTPLEANTGKIDQINNMFWMNVYTKFINLQNVFTRTCGLWGVGSDWTPCNTWGVISTTPLVILNGNYPSILLQ